jgi:plastin-1
MIRNASNIKVPEIVRPEDIVSANVKINTVYVSYIFNIRHGLQELTAEEYEAAKLVFDDIEGSKEERQFRFWINSLDIDGLYVNNLYEEARDGLLLLKVIAKLEPTAIDWKKVEKNPNNKFKMGINCN